jgi:predicted DNA-binding protein (MmcQ/YjbR family)
MPPRPLTRLRKICLKLADTTEVESWGEPTFRVKNKIFAMYASQNTHHGGGRPGVWLKATPTNQDLVLNAQPDRYFKPPYVGPSGWIGVWLDGEVDWEALEGFIDDAYALAAPKKRVRKPTGSRA